MEKKDVLVKTFYKFVPIAENDLPQLEELFCRWADELNVRGLVILATEGINTTLSAEPEDLITFRNRVFERLELTNRKVEEKDSWTDHQPFRRFTVKVREEIVTLGRPGLAPDKDLDHHLSPKDWHQALQDPNTLVIDTRNDYEVEIGKFKQAVDPNISNFQEFTKYLKDEQVPKDKKILIYCTGGIRCEKAILDMRERGFNDVYQLQGGILNYLKEFPEGDFEGECFVFDHRVAVDGQLQPSKTYRLCPHCGNPGQVKINCLHCGDEEIVCQTCIDKDEARQTCSKNCAHHHREGHEFRRAHRQGFRKQGT